MPTRVTQHAGPPDAAGHAGSFERDQASLVEPSAGDLPGATWESPRKGEKKPRADLGLVLTVGLAVLGAVVLLAYCAAPHV